MLATPRSVRFPALFCSMLLFLFSATLLSFTTHPSSYRFVNPTMVADTQPYANALNRSDLDRYRYLDERNVLVFDTGLHVELLSANELLAQGLPVNMNRVRTEKPVFDTGSVFKLSPQGGLVEIMTKTKVK
jgi:hypothetical protein